MKRKLKVAVSCHYVYCSAWVMDLFVISYIRRLPCQCFFAAGSSLNCFIEVIVFLEARTTGDFLATTLITLIVQGFP